MSVYRYQVADMCSCVVYL